MTGRSGPDDARPIPQRGEAPGTAPRWEDDPDDVYVVDVPRSQADGAPTPPGPARPSSPGRHTWPRVAGPSARSP